MYEFPATLGAREGASAQESLGTKQSLKSFVFKGFRRRRAQKH